MAHDPELPFQHRGPAPGASAPSSSGEPTPGAFLHQPRHRSHYSQGLLTSGLSLMPNALPSCMGTQSPSQSPEPAQGS